METFIGGDSLQHIDVNRKVQATGDLSADVTVRLYYNILLRFLRPVVSTVVKFLNNLKTFNLFFSRKLFR